MFKEVKPIDRHTYKSVQLTVENVHSFVQEVPLHNPSDIETSIQRAIDEGEPIELNINGQIFGVFIGQYVVLQYDLTGDIDGCIACDTKEEFDRFFIIV